MQVTDGGPRKVTNQHTHADSPQALTLTELMDQLFEAPWPERWRILLSEPRLLHSSVARACATADPLLALVIEHAATAGMQRADLRELELIQRRIDRGSSNGGPDSGHVTLVRDFHQWLWLQSVSKQLKLMAESLWTGQCSYTRSPIPDQVQRSTHDHHATIASLKAGDSSAARAMEDHILNSRDALLIYRNVNSEKAEESE